MRKEFDNLTDDTNIKLNEKKNIHKQLLGEKKCKILL